MRKNKHWREQQEENFKQLKGAKTRLLKPLTPGQAEYFKSIEEKQITIITGDAGTGKSFCMVGIAVQLLMANRVSKILLSRPLQTCGEDMGFLPGDISEKIAPYMLPMLDAVLEFMSKEEAEEKIKTGIIEICPLATMRGRTFHNAFMILDEAQNATYSQIKMFLTRIGENSKIVIAGDTTQSDLNGYKINPLADIISKLDGMKEVGVCELGIEDIVRNGIIKEILKRLGEK